METSLDEGAVAIIGLAGRFPGVHTVDTFWRNIQQGKEAITFLTDEQIRTARVPEEEFQHPDSVRACSPLADIEYFDASFFGYTPREAQLMDPQQRLFLECAWTALEHAGYDPDRYAQSIGVFAGSSQNTYALYRAQLTSYLQASGAILFRHFAISSVEAFQSVARALSDELLDYTERSTPRSTVAGKILTSTEYPADQSIQMHSEMSYASHWPGKIWFYCVQPAQEGGIPPLADNRKVYRLLDPSVRRLFKEKQVLYVRTYGEQLNLPWQEVFQTEDVRVVEAYCRQAGINFHWQGHKQLRTWQVCQAVIRHPHTNDMLWFKQAHLLHKSSLDARVRTSLLQVMAEDELPRNACFGDVYQQVTVRISWQQGDLVLLDNMLIAHGRDPFSGPRTIVVAMAEKYTSR